MADLSTLLPDGDVLWEGGNVIELPNLVSGPLADLLAAAGAEGRTSELSGEATMRHEFREAAIEWPSVGRRHRRASVACAASLVAGMILATTGLAAATDLPLPTTHLVDQAITQINHDLASPPTANALTGLRPGVTPVRHHAVVYRAATVPALRHVPEPSKGMACPSGTTATGGPAGSCLPAPAVAPTASGSATASAGTVTAVSGGTRSVKTSASKSGTRKTSKSGTHKTSGGGSSRGGNHGRGGTHKKGGGGSSRGGNHGRGGTHKKGSGGSSRGANRGTTPA